MEGVAHVAPLNGSEPEVGENQHPGSALACPQEVLGLDVTVDDAARVAAGDRRGHHAHEARSRRLGIGALVHVVRCQATWVGRKERKSESHRDNSRYRSSTCAALATKITTALESQLLVLVLVLVMMIG